MLSVFHFQENISILLRQHSGFEILPITMQVCERFSACCDPAANAAFSTLGSPAGLWARSIGSISSRCFPRVGTVISGVRGPYAYLPASVERFPAPEEMLARMKNAGFAEASWTPYTFGIAGLYRGKKS